MTRQPTAADWLTAAQSLATASQRPGESFEQAFARVVAKGAGAAFMAMHRAPQGRVPAPVRVVYKGERAENAEAALHRLAITKAASTGKSYEVAMAEALATPEGLALWQAAREAEEPRRCLD